jgi:hypothetical protein
MDEHVSEKKMKKKVGGQQRRGEGGLKENAEP